MKLNISRNDWIIQRLGDFVISAKGKKPKNQSDIQTDVYKYPYVDIQGFEKNIFDSYADGQNCTFCTEDDFLMVWDGSRSGLVGKAVNGAIGSTLVKINLPKIENLFAYYFLKSKYIELNTNAKGTGTPHVNPDLLWNYSFPIVPLLEQKAIVAKIEQLFSELDNGIENLKTAQAKLKIYRQAVLTKAFQGEFTREWRERQNNPQIQKWCEVELKEIVMDVTQGWSPKCLNEHSFDHEEWAVIKTSAIQHNAFLEYENKILPTHLEPRIQHELKDGDILITRAGPRNRVGVCCLIENIRPRLINCDKAYRLRLNNEKILNKFFILKINSHEYIQKIDFIKTGGSDSGLNLTQTRFLSLVFSVPSLEEQNQIVQEIESRLSICDKIEETIKQTLQKSEALRQSILKKAFEGNLLNAQELDAIHNHPDYESAEKLLKRIKQERAKQ